MPPEDSANNPFNAICSQWMEKIKKAKKQKEERFGKYAKEASDFFNGSHDFMWKGEYAKGVGGFLEKGTTGVLPTFRMTVNRVFEAVALFGPVLYHRNPSIQVNPKITPKIEPMVLGLNPDDQNQMQQWQQMEFESDFENAKKRNHAKLKEHFLNWVQHETDKKDQARMAINEAIIKGMGLLWTEMYQPSGSETKYPRSVYVSVDDLVIDPDAQYWEDVQWIARRCVHPVWKVEREYGLEPGYIRGNMSSLSAQSEVKNRGRKESSGDKRKGTSYDLIEYWQIFTKSGFGDKLKVTNREKKPTKFDYSIFGDFCYLAVSEDIPFPLNLPPKSLEEDQESVFMRAQWPIPFWTDGGWPFSKLHFYEKPKEVWPISLIKPAIGELRFVNWCMSFLADKVAAASTTYVAIAKAAGAEIQDQIKSGMGPYSVIEVSEIYGGKIQDMISFLDSPSFNVDIWRMVSEVLDMIDKRTGLTELLYGLSGSTQIRSATEADVRNQNVSVRPDDMASRVEDWLSSCALKEIEAAEWSMSAEDIYPILGQVGAIVWDQQISQTDFERTVRDYDYRVEAGSARKPNKTNRIRQLNDFGQIAMPLLQEFVGMGISGPYNAYLTDWAKANELDVEPYLIDMEEIRAQQQEEEAAAQEGNPEMEMQQQQIQMQQQMAQLELQEKQLDMQSKQFEMQIKQAEAQSKQSDSANAQKVALQKAQTEQQKIQIEQAKHMQDMQQDSERHIMELEQAKEKHQLELEFMREKSRTQKEMTNAKKAQSTQSE